MKYSTPVTIAAVSAILASSLLATTVWKGSKGVAHEHVVITSCPNVDVRHGGPDLSGCLQRYEQLKPKGLDVHDPDQVEAIINTALSRSSFPLKLSAVVPVRDAPSLGFGLVIQLQAKSSLQLESLSSVVYHFSYHACLLTYLLLKDPSIHWLVFVLDLRSDSQVNYDAAVTIVFDRDAYRRLAWPVLLCTEPGQHHLFSATAYTISDQLYSNLRGVLPRESQP